MRTRNGIPSFHGAPDSHDFQENHSHSDHYIDPETGATIIDAPHALTDGQDAGVDHGSVYVRNRDRSLLAQTDGYDSQRGTALHDLANSFLKPGIAVEHSFDTPLADLHDALVGGEKVFVGLVGSPDFAVSGDGHELSVRHLGTGRTRSW